MSAANRLSDSRSRRPSAQAGAAAVEVGILSMVFFLVVFGALELARVMYVWNTLQEVTRHAASDLVNLPPADPDSPSMVDVRRRAIFQTTGDNLPLAAPVGVNQVRIDYLSLTRDPVTASLQRVPTSPAPTCAAANRQTCMANPNDAACARFVRVRICAPGGAGTCNQVKLEPLVSLVDFGVLLPRSSTIATVESLGYFPGMPPCP